MWFHFLDALMLIYKKLAVFKAWPRVIEDDLLPAVFIRRDHMLLKMSFRLGSNHSPLLEKWLVLESSLTYIWEVNNTQKETKRKQRKTKTISKEFDLGWKEKKIQKLKNSFGMKQKNKKRTQIIIKVFYERFEHLFQKP